MKTTYIMGAGASQHAGYPFANSLGRGLLRWMKAQRELVYFDYPANAEYLEQRFGDDIEALLRGIQRSLRKQEFDHTSMANFYKPSLVQAMREWFAEIHHLHHPYAYEKFAANIVKPNDCVITFNYDVSLDSQLRRAGKWTLGDGYGFRIEGFPLHSPVTLLKLHGSINWLAVLFGGMTGSFVLPSSGAFGNRPAIPDSDLGAIGYEGVVDLLWPRCGTAAILPLILPTSRKRFYLDTNVGREWASFWRKLWSAAKGALRTSDKIVICGYGLSPIDKRGRNLLLNGVLDAPVEVCSGSQTDKIVEELQAHCRNAVAAKDVYFQDWVNSHC